jgi:hypothetical protein
MNDKVIKAVEKIQKKELRVFELLKYRDIKQGEVAICSNELNNIKGQIITANDELSKMYVELRELFLEDR